MSRTAFEDLEVYQLAERLAQGVWRLVRKWDGLARDTVGKQLIRSADSIGANIAEGFGRGNGADHKRFVRISRGSLCEVKHWLRLAYGRGLVVDEDVQCLKPLLDELAPRLNAYLKAIGRERPSTINIPQSTISTGG
jgi:four helix bundle protein